MLSESFFYFPSECLVRQRAIFSFQRSRTSIHRSCSATAKENPNATIRLTPLRRQPPTMFKLVEPVLESPRSHAQTQQSVRVCESERGVVRGTARYGRISTVPSPSSSLMHLPLITITTPYSQDNTYDKINTNQIKSQHEMHKLVAV